MIINFKKLLCSGGGGGGCKLIDKTFTENGVFTAEVPFDGFKEITINVKELNWDGASIDEETQQRNINDIQKSIDATKRWVSNYSGTYFEFRGSEYMYLPQNIDASHITKLYETFAYISAKEIPNYSFPNAEGECSFFIEKCPMLETVGNIDFGKTTAIKYTMQKEDIPALKKVGNFNMPNVTEITASFKFCFANCESIGEWNVPSLKSWPLSQNGYTMFNSDLKYMGGFKDLKISLNTCPDSYYNASNLTKESVMNIINKLGQADPAFEAEPTLTLASTPYSLLTPDDIKIATDKGWKVVSK